MIERLSEKDVNGMLFLCKEAEFNDCWSQSQIISGFNNNLHAFGIVSDSGELCAFITIDIGADFCDIEDVVVHPHFRRRGLAQRLVNFAVKFAFTNGAQKAFLEVRENNASAISLYKKCGFNQLSMRKKYYADGENAIVMVKEK